jgi:mRNA interferase YafQ
MRTIERTGQFKRDYKRESKGQHRLVLDDAFLAVLKLLIADKPLWVFRSNVTSDSGRT